MFSSRIDGSRSSDHAQFQCGELIIDTVVAVAVSAIAFGLAGRCDWHQPRLASALRMIPVGAAFLWLLRRFCSCPSGYWTSPAQSDFYYPDDDRSTIVRPRYFGSLFGRNMYNTGLGFQTTSTAPGPHHIYTDGSTVAQPRGRRGGDDTQIFPAGGTGTRAVSTFISGGPGPNHSYVSEAPAPQQQSWGGLSSWFSSKPAGEPTIFAAGGSDSSRSNHSSSSYFDTTSSFSTASSFPSVTTPTSFSSSPEIFPASGGNTGGGGQIHTYTS